MQRDTLRRGRWVLALALAILSAWAVAASIVQLPVTVASQDGRIVSVSEPVTITANSDQPIASIAVKLGDHVSAGDLLLAFDDSELQLDRNAKRAHLATLTTQLSDIEKQLQNSRTRLELEQRTFDHDRERILAKIQQAEAALQYSTEAVRIYSELRSERRIDELKYQQNFTQRKQDLMALKALQAELTQTAAEKNLAYGNWQKEFDELKTSRNQVAGEIRELEPELKRLEQDIRRLKILAVSNGTIGSIAAIAPGQRLAVDDFLMTLIPQQKLQFRGSFLASEGAARIHSGQQAEIEFSALPWTEFGTLSADVARVGNEEQDGMIAVDFTLGNDEKLNALIGYGLKGRASVKIDHATLFQKLIRLLGQPEPPQA